jgi:hypothetical protein
LLIGELKAFMFENKFEKRMQEHAVFKKILNGNAGGGGGACKGVREALRGTVNFTGGAVVLLVGTAITKWTATAHCHHCVPFALCPTARAGTAA